MSEYTEEFYQDMLYRAEVNLLEIHRKLDHHSPGTPAHKELSLIIQSLRKEIVELRPLAYPESLQD